MASQERKIEITIIRIEISHEPNVESHIKASNLFTIQGDYIAIKHYEKFLDLWKDADPGIAELEDAGKRLAGLN